MSRLLRCWLILLFVAEPAFAAAPPSRCQDLYGDPLPPGAVARLGTVRWRRGAAFVVSNPILSPDGRWLAHQDSFDTLAVWETGTGRLLRILERGFEEDSAVVGRMAFTPDNKGLLSIDDEGAVFSLWDLATGRARRRWNGPKQLPSALAIRRDGLLAAVGTNEGEVHLYDLRTGKHLRSLPGKESIHAIAFTADGCLSILTVEEEGWGVRRIDLLTRQQLLHFKLPERASWVSNAVGLSPDGQYIAFRSFPAGLFLCQVSSGVSRHVEDVPEADLDVLRFAPDGRTLVACGEISQGTDREYVVWLCDVASAKAYHRFRCSEAPNLVNSILLSSDRKTLFMPCGGSRVHLWDTRRGRKLQDHPGLDNTIQALAYAPDGRSLVVQDGFRLSRWDSVTGRRLTQPAQMAKETVLRTVTPTGFMKSVFLMTPEMAANTFAPGGALLAHTQDQDVFVVDSRTGNVVRRLIGHTAEVKHMAFSADGKRLASADAKGVVRLWNVASGKVQRVIDTRERMRQAGGLLFSPDGRILVVPEEANLHFWDVSTGKHLGALYSATKEEETTGLDRGQWSGVFSRDGRLLFSALQRGIRVWDVVEKKEVHVEQLDPRLLNPLSFPARLKMAISADGRYLAKAEAQSGVVLYETASGQAVHQFRFSGSRVCFAPSEWRLATANSQDLCILTWDLGTLFRSLPPPRPGVQSPAILWDDLGDRDAGRAHRALWRMASLPGVEPFLTEQLHPVQTIRKDRLEKWVKDLSNDVLPVRQRAEKELIDVRDAARAILERAFDRAADLEVRARLERVLARLSRRSPERLREVRAVMILEMRSTPEARQLLRSLAGGLPEARLTREAKEALKRLRARRATFSGPSAP